MFYDKSVFWQNGQNDPGLGAVSQKTDKTDRTDTTVTSNDTTVTSNDTTVTSNARVYR